VGSACRGAPSKPRCADHRRSADPVSKLGPNGSVAGEAGGRVPGVGRTRRAARRPRSNVGLARGPASGAHSSRCAGTSSDVGIPGRCGGPRAKLGGALACIAARRGRAHMGCPGAFNLAASGAAAGCPGARMGRAGRRCPRGSGARCTDVADAERAFVEPARSGVGGS
jgi:hypothetical protein